MMASPASSTPAPSWAGLTSLLARALPPARTVVLSRLTARQDALGRTLSCLEASKQETVAALVACGGEGDFAAGLWQQLSTLNDAIGQAASRFYETKAKTAFPSHFYSYGSDGILLGFKDWWLSSFSAALFSVNLLPAIGEVWLDAGLALASKKRRGAGSSIPASFSVRADKVALDIHLEQLGLLGDSIPSALRNSAGELSLDLAVELDLAARFVFSPPSIASNTPSAVAASAVSSSTTAGIDGRKNGPASAKENALLTFRWALAPETPSSSSSSSSSGSSGSEAFKLLITKISYKAKGGLPIPDAVLKLALNSILPGRVKAMLLASLPLELGVLLSLHSGCALSFSSSISVSSLPFALLKAPLDAAPSLLGTSSIGKQKPLSFEQAHAAATTAAASAIDGSGAGGSVVGGNAGSLAGIALQTMGLNAAQARLLLQAQQHHHHHSGTAGASSSPYRWASMIDKARAYGSSSIEPFPPLRTAADFAAFSSLFNPDSLMRRKISQEDEELGLAEEEDVGEGGRGGGGAAADSLERAAAEAVDRDNARRAFNDAIALLQRLVTEYAVSQVSALKEKAGAAAVPATTAEHLNRAGDELAKAAATMDLKACFVAVDALVNAKPTRLSLTVKNDFQVRIPSIEAAVGGLSCWSMRLLQEQRKAVFRGPSAGTNASAIGLAARGKEKGKSDGNSRNKGLFGLFGAGKTAKAESSAPIAGKVMGDAPPVLSLSSFVGAAPTPPPDTNIASTAVILHPPAKANHPRPAHETQVRKPTGAEAEEEVRKWASSLRSRIDALHATLTRASAEISGRLSGEGEEGERTKGAKSSSTAMIAIRTLQLELEPGASLPYALALPSFLPPGDMCNVLEETAGEGGEQQRLFSCKLAYPRSESEEEDIGIGLDKESASASASASTAVNGKPKQEADVDVMATILVRRAFLGLRVDEALLLQMVEERKKKAAEAESKGGKGRAPLPPPLIACDLDLRAKPSSSSGFNLTLSSAEWTRLVVEAQSLQARGNVPVLKKWLSSHLKALWSSLSGGSGGAPGQSRKRSSAGGTPVVDGSPARPDKRRQGFAAEHEALFHRLRSYLTRQSLRFGCDLDFLLLSLPSPPVIRLDAEDGNDEHNPFGSGSMASLVPAGDKRRYVPHHDPRLLAMAGLQADDEVKRSSTAKAKMLSVSLSFPSSSPHKTLIPRHESDDAAAMSVAVGAAPLRAEELERTHAFSLVLDHLPLLALLADVRLLMAALKSEEHADAGDDSEEEEKEGGGRAH